jgi:hypothetical protein
MDMARTTKGTTTTMTEALAPIPPLRPQEVRKRRLRLRDAVWERLVVGALRRGMSVSDYAEILLDSHAKDAAAADAA